MIPGAGDGDGALDSSPPPATRTHMLALAQFPSPFSPCVAGDRAEETQIHLPPLPKIVAVSLVGHSQCHCTANVIASDSRLSRPTLDVAQGFVSQHWLAHASLRRRQQTPRPVIVIPLDPYHVPSPPPPTGSSRTEAQRWPACATRATTSLPICSLPIHDASDGTADTYPSPWASRYQVAAMVHRSPITTSTLARPVRTSRPWIPRHYPATSSAAGEARLALLFAHLPVTFLLRSAPPSTVPTGRRGLLSPTPTSRWVKNIARARRLTDTLAFAICHLRSVTCGRPCVLIFPQLRRCAIP